MNNMVSMHDQTLMFIKTDSYTTQVDGSISFELIAREFEMYWRAIVSVEVNEFLGNHFEKEKSFALQDAKDLIRTVWGNK